MTAGCGTRIVRPDGAVELKYRAEAGTTRRYALEQVLRGKVALGGLPQLVVIRLKGTMDETCEKQLKGGWARLRIRYAYEPPEMNGMAMPGAERTETVLRVRRSPAGELEAMDGEAAPADAIAWAGRVLGGMNPALPPAPVRAGESWTRALTLPSAGGTLTGSATATFKGWDVAGPRRRAVIADRGEVALADAPPGGGVERFTLSFAGTAAFDPADGALVSAERSGDLHVKARDGKTRVEAIFKFTSTLTLR